MQYIHEYGSPDICVSYNSFPLNEDDKSFEDAGVVFATLCKKHDNQIKNVLYSHRADQIKQANTHNDVIDYFCERGNGGIKQLKNYFMAALSYNKPALI